MYNILPITIQFKKNKTPYQQCHSEIFLQLASLSGRKKLHFTKARDLILYRILRSN